MPDGRTATSLDTQGLVTDIRTGTVHGANAFNSFSRFNIGHGQTVRLHLPGGTDNLLNLVRHERSSLDGVMNAYQDGRIGGNVFFFNPHGVVVGAQGQINVGSLMLAAPTVGFVDRMVDGAGRVDAATVDAALAGRVPLSPSGLITVEGRIRAARLVQLAAAGVQVGATGEVIAGPAAQVGFGTMVNIEGLDDAAGAGAVRIVGGDDVALAGRVAADGASGVSAGRIDVEASGDIRLVAGARVSADGRGARSDGGDVRIFAGVTASLDAGAEVSARGGEVSGDGGRIEFSAVETVRLAGGELKAGANVGRRGSVLIDPNDIEVVSADQHTDGADFTLIANDRITVGADITVSTRDTGAGDPLTASSRGNSGNLTLRASHIELQSGSRLLAHADNGHAAGDVEIDATMVDIVGANRDARASATLTRATVTGGNVLIRASAETSLVNQLLEGDPSLSVADAQRQIDNELDDPVDGVAGQFLTVTTNAAASTTLRGSTVHASGDLTIASRAGARAGFEKTATANTTVSDSDLRGRDVRIEADASTSLIYPILGAATELLDQSWLPDPDSSTITKLDDKFFDYNAVPLVSLSTASAVTLIDGASRITALRDAVVDAAATSAAKPNFSSPLLFAAAWGESSAEASARMLGTTVVDADRALQVTAATDSDIDVTASVDSINKPVDVTYVRANTNMRTIAEIGDGTRSSAGSIAVEATTEAEINAAADAKNTGGSGVGLALAVSDSRSETRATLGGVVLAREGDVRVNADADIEESTSANAATLGNPSSISAKITNFKAGIQRNVVGSILGATGALKAATADRLTKFLFPGIKEGKFNAAGAVAWTDAANVATASIAPRADVFATGGDLEVTARISDRPGSSSGAKTTSTGTAIGGSVANGRFANSANAFIGDGAVVDATGATRVVAKTLVPYPWEIDWKDPQEIVEWLKSGAADMFLSTYTINSAKGKSGLGLAVGVNLFDIDNHANAWIDTGVKVNTRFVPVIGRPEQAVEVAASNDVSLTAAAGILSKKFLGTSGGKAAVGGSAGLIGIGTQSSATIRGNAQVQSAALDVRAENLQRVVSVTEAGGSSDAVGVEGAVSINTLDNRALAAIDDDALIDAKGDIDVAAGADLRNVSVAGGVVTTKGPVGIGFSVSLNTISSDVAAFIGEFDPLGDDDASATGSVDSRGQIGISAHSDISQGAYSVAGAVATKSAAQTEMPDDASDTQDGSSSAGGASKSGKGKFGIAVSGDASINDIAADTRAEVRDGALIRDAASLSLNAENRLAIRGWSGAVTISTQPGGNSLAGSYAQNSLTGTTAASADDATIRLGGAFDADAHVGGEIVARSASLAGTGGKAGVAGSVSINDIDNRTASTLDGVELTGGTDVRLNAHDDSSIRAFAGTLAFGGKAGIGLSFSWNQLGNRTESLVNDSDVDARALVNLDARSDNSIDARSAAIGASVGPIAGAGAVTINSIRNDTRSAIAGQLRGDGVDGAGGVAVSARDSSRIYSLAGSIGGGTGTAGVGASFAWNDIDNRIDARLRDSADVASTGGDVRVASDSTTKIESVSASGAVASTAGVAGSASVVQAGAKVTAAIDDGSAAVADGNVQVAASDRAELFSLAGNVAGGGSAAIGLSASVLLTDNLVAARIDGEATGRGHHEAMAVPTGEFDADGAPITESQHGVAVSATSHEKIETIAAGGAGAGSVGAAGSASVTELNEETNASTGAAARINPADDGHAAQRVTVHASDHTRLLGVAGAVGFGGSGGVGAGSVVSLVDKHTAARVDGQLRVKDTLTIEAINREDITSVAASLSVGGSAGIAGSASVLVMDVDTTGEVADRAQVRSEGNVAVAADDASEVDLIAGNGAFGGSAGVGASAAVAIIDKTTKARVGEDAEVTALGARAGIEVADGSFTTEYGANAGHEGEVSAPAASNPDGSDSQALTGQRSGRRGTRAGFTGLAVSATNRDDVETISATGAGAGSAAITLAGDVNVITTRTDAQIADRARVNQDNVGAGASQSVLVAAGNDHYQMGIAGSASGAGAVGIGAVADVLVARHHTSARIGDAALLRARRDTAVLATSRQEVLSIAAGLGVGGTVGVAGSTSVLSIGSLTTATTGEGSRVDADGNVRIVATDDTRTDVIDGTLAAGFGVAGVGGAVGVTRIEKDTTAGVGAGATVIARGQGGGAMQALSGDGLDHRKPIDGLSIEASSSEDLFSVAASGAGGFYAGVSGAVTVSSVDSDTTAVIGRDARINPGLAVGSATQDVNVSARNSVALDAYTGSLALGAVGAAGGVDVGTVRNDTTAAIDDGAQVASQRDVDVNALADAQIGSVVVSASGGVGAIAGGVAVYSVGSGLDDEGTRRLRSDGGDAADVNSYADDQAQDDSVRSLLDGSDDARIRDAGARSQSERAGVAISNDLGDAASSGTTARIGAATVVAGGAIDVDARQAVDVDVMAGAAAAGAVGLGAGVGVVTLNAGTAADVAATARLGSGGAMSIAARTDNRIDLTGFAGSFGAVAIDAAVAVAKDHSETRAAIGDGVEVERAASVELSASDERRIDSEAVGVSVAAGAVGASVATARIDGTTGASVGGGVRIGGAAAVGRMELSASSTTDATARSTAGKAGLAFAQSGSVATAESAPTVRASIGQDSRIDVAGDVTLKATGQAGADADAIGVNVAGGVGIGASVARASAAPDIAADIDRGATIQADTLDVAASQSLEGDGVSAHAVGASGGLIYGVNASRADADNSGRVEARIDENGMLDVANRVSVTAANRSRQRADVTGVTVGGLAAGSTVSLARSATTTLASIGDGTSIAHVGGSTGLLRVQARGDEDNQASTVAGSGGLGSLVAARADTDTRTQTRASLGDLAGGRVEAGRIEVDASQAVRFDARANSTNASVVGYSGARASNHVDTDTLATLGQRTELRTEALSLGARNVVTKPAASGYQVDSGSGGYLNGAAASSQSLIRNRARVEVGDSAIIRVERSGDELGTLDLAAENRVVARDAVRLDSGGAIAVARSESTIDNAVNDGTIRVGRDASIRSDGEINLSARTSSEVDAQARSKTYGAAGAAQGRSRALIGADNRVEVAAGALIESERDVHLMAGTDRSQANKLDADADTRLWNRTAVPIETDPQAHAGIRQHNTIDVAAGARVRSVRSVHLTASEGRHTTRGFGEGTDLYREILSAIGEFFGADTSSLKIRAGSTSDNSNSAFDPGSGVHVDGLVEAGIWHQQYLIYHADGSASMSENVSYALRDDVRLADELAAEIAALRAKAGQVRDAADEYSGDSSATDYALALDNDADILEAQLTELDADTRVGFLDVNPVLATTGNVHVRGDYLSGGAAGKLEAPGDVRIDIENRSLRFMTTDALTVPDDDGGQVTFNGLRVSSAAAINARNAAGRSASMAVVDAQTSAKPVIRIDNANDGDTATGQPPQLWITGDISNLRGLAQASSHGTIRASANINAETVDIATGGDFIKTYTPGFTHQGGDPISQLGTLPDAREGFANGLPFSDAIDSTLGDYATDSPPYLCTGDRCSTTIAGNNVYISGEKLNLNGLIQAGLPDRRLVITDVLVAAKAAEIATAKADFASDPVNAPRYLDLNDPDPASTEIKVRYDLAEDRLELANVRMGGGHMELFGDIFSTGHGELKVLDGYGRIRVDNQSRFDLVLNRVDTGPGVEGKIKFTDTAKRVIAPGVVDFSGRSRAGAPLVTEVTRLGGTVLVTDSRTVDAGGRPSHLVSATRGRDSAYDPVADRRFNWINGRRQQWTEERIYTTRILFGADWLFPDFDNPDKVTAETPVYTSRLTGDWLSVGGGSVDYRHDYTQRTTGKSRSGDPYEKSRSESLCVPVLGCGYQEVTIGTKFVWNVYDYYHHSLDASHRIDISFTGFDSSDVSVSSPFGQVWLAGLVRSLSGDTTIDAAAGIGSLNDSAYIAGSQVNLSSAAGAIGTAERPVRIDLTDADAARGLVDGQLSATARDSLSVAEIGGDLRVAAAQSSAGTVTLSADRHLRGVDPLVTIVGQGVRLVSRSGDIGHGDSPLRVDNQDVDGVLSASASGDIDLLETVGDMRVGRIDSVAGDVRLTVPGGSLVDANPVEQRDEKTIEELRTLWDDMRLRGDPARAAADQTIAAYAERNEADYQRYWEMRNLRQGDGGPVADAYDADFAFRLDAASAGDLKAANGWTDDDVQAYESNQTDFYHDAHRRFGDGPYVEGYRYAVSDDEAARLREGSVWNDRELSNALGAGLFRPVADTEVRIEDPNVSGRTVTLVAAGSIGRDDGEIVIARGSDPEALSEEAKLALLTAERQDLTLTDDEIRIRRFEDLDVEASAGLVAAATGKILIGAEQDLAIAQIVSADEVRIKSGAGLRNAALPGQPAIRAGALVLEAGQGSIGSADAPMRIDLADEARLTARARDELHITEHSGDLHIGSVYAQNLAALVAAGAILDAGEDSALDVQARDVDLRAGTTIGTSGGPQGALEVNVAATGLLSAMAPGGVYLASVGQGGRLGSILTGGDFSYHASAGSLSVLGQISAGHIRLSADDDVVVDSSGGVTSTSDLEIDAGRDLRMVGDLRADGDASLGAGRDIDGMSRVNVGRQATVAAGAAVTLGGEFRAGADLGIRSGAGIRLTGALSATGDAQLVAGDDVIVESSGGVATMSDLEIDAGRDLRMVGDLRADGDASLSAGRDIDGMSRVDVGRQATVAAGAAVTLGGEFRAGADLGIRSGAGIRLTGALSATGDAKLVADDDVGFTAGRLLARRIDVEAGRDGGGSVLGHSADGADLIASESAVIRAPDAIGVGSALELQAPRVELVSSRIDAAVAASIAGGPLEVDAIGIGGANADAVTLTLTGAGRVSLGRLHATRSTVTTDAPALRVLDARVGDMASFYTPAYSVHIDHLERRARPEFDARGFTRSGLYDLEVTLAAARLGAHLISANPHKVVIGEPPGNATVDVAAALAGRDAQRDSDLDPRSGDALPAPPSRAGLVTIERGLFDCDARIGCEREDDQ